MKCLENIGALDLKLSIECATSFSELTGLGCTISDYKGHTLHEAGYGYCRCQACDAAGLDRTGCHSAHEFGMAKAERIGGKFIYFCPMGFTFFVSPIISPQSSEAGITAGPFLMVDRDDYELIDLQEKLCLRQDAAEQVSRLLDHIPYVPPRKANTLSNILFMLAGFINSHPSEIKKPAFPIYYDPEFTDGIPSLFEEESVDDYPIKTEKELISSIAESDKPKAQRHLNELLGHILFSSGSDLPHIKTRIFELLVIMSRAAVDSGIPADETFRINHRFLQLTQSMATPDEICLLITEIMNQYIDDLFNYSSIKNVDICQKAIQFIHKNYSKKITLDDVARAVYLSPSYFSKMFKKEMRCSFNTYLNQVRIKRSTQFLLYQNVRMNDIAILVGFDDQSYFTKVFKRVVGVLPSQYRNCKGRL